MEQTEQVQMALDILPQWKIIFRDREGKATDMMEGNDHLDAARMSKLIYPDAHPILVRIK